MEFNGYPSLREYENACAGAGFQTRRESFRKDGESYFALITTPPGHPTGTSVESWHLFTADETEHVLDGIIRGEGYLPKLAAHGYFPETAQNVLHNDPPPAAETNPASSPYYPIDEATAQRSHDMMSMREYKPGSATAGYRAAVDEAAALVECKKQKVSPFYHDKLDALLDRYARRLADWTNAHNRNGASCPSILVSGRANFPIRKKEKQNAREDRLWKEYQEIQGILSQIESVGTGPIDLTDPHARDLLSSRATALQEELKTGKAMNAHYRKYKTMQGFPGLSDASAAEMDDGIRRCPSFMQTPFPDFELASLRRKIKTAQDRLATLDRLQAAQKSPAENIKFDGGEIVRNASENRLQILFDATPDADLRAQLKNSGFHWSPKNKAWQRILTRNALYDARRILNIPSTPKRAACETVPETPSAVPAEIPMPDPVLGADGQYIFPFV